MRSFFAAVFVAMATACGATGVSDRPASRTCAIEEDAPSQDADAEPEPALSPSSRTEDASSPRLPPGPERLSYVPANVMDLVTRARHALQGMPFDVSGCEGPGAGELACRGDYLLAVTDASGTIAYVTAYEGKPPSKEGYAVALGADGGRVSGVNPDIQVTHPPGITVLALKTVVNWAGKPAAAVYVPYSDEINTPQVRAAGIAYLWSQVRIAADRLRAAGVRSKFFDEPVPDVIPADHVFTLVLTENVTHPEPFLPSGKEEARLELLNEALAQLGANQSKAWDFRASRVGARGKGQLMPKTYKALCKAYGLDCPDHAEGARDDTLVFELMFLHADDEWRGIKHRDWLRERPSLMRLYLAAGYNGFYGHAAKAIRACGMAGWREPSPGCASPVRPETRPYLYKYEWIRGQIW